jgi:predicted metalloenzyme YecM
MTPLRVILQQVNDTPYTTPAKRGLEIGSRVYCRNVISGRPFFGTNLNRPLQIVEWPISPVSHGLRINIRQKGIKKGVPLYSNLC